ncbi:MAG: hypothetical protein HWD61_08880 [Parachlamydiaceae bacterium]|nr:MAG: hypothetical protein HWD61_08880 [Parachlamydiaceae bacterium]
MSIKSLLNKGDINCSTLEKVADTILSGPRGMWLGRNVTVTQNSTGKLDAIDLKSFSFHDKIWETRWSSQEGELVD